MRYLPPAGAGQFPPPAPGYPQQPHPQHPLQPHSQHPHQPPHPQHPPQYRPAPKRGLSAGAIVGIVAGALALLLAAGVALFFAARPSTAPPRNAAQAVAAVEGFLEAVAASDARAAQQYTSSFYQNDLLTDAVLERSNELAPITAIEVSDEARRGDSADQTLVSAAFKVGGTTERRTYRVSSYGNDTPEIYDALERIHPFGFTGLDATINGVPIQDESYAVFPGTYELTLANDLFAVGSIDLDEGEAQTTGKPFTVVNSKDAEQMSYLEARLSDKGTRLFRELVTAAVAECVAMTTLATPCGLDVSEDFTGSAQPIDGTVQRTITPTGAKELAAFEPRPDYEYPTLVTAYLFVDIDTSVEVSEGNDPATRERAYGSDLLSPFVDFSEETPSVVWH
ncbi:hypothetical protein GCM10020360_27320 [Nonlabens tegetincola]